MADEEVLEGDKLTWILTDPSPEALLAYVRAFFTVPDERGIIHKMDPKPQQEMMARDATGRDLTVKARQTGSSTFNIMKRVRRMTNGTLYGANCLIAFDRDETTRYFRGRINHHLADLSRKGFKFKTSSNNEDMITIEGLDNSFFFGSGEQEHIGISKALQDVMISEYAHWNPRGAANLLGETMPAVPPPPYGVVDIESTTNGDSGDFYDLCQSAKPYGDSLWSVRFYPWWTDPRYYLTHKLDERADLYVTESEYLGMMTSFSPDSHETWLMSRPGFAENETRAKEKILWRRKKKPEQDRTPKPFDQEFPETFDSCWLGKEGRYFDTPDGVDHIGFYRQRTEEPAIHFEKLTFKGDEILFHGPNLRVWEAPHRGVPYVCWGDAAGGGQSKDADPTVIVVWDAQREKVVARFSAKIGPKVAGGIMCAIGAYYGMAMCGFERSAHGDVAMKEMRDLGYPRSSIYMDYREKNPEGGIYPTPRNREQILENFKDGITSHRPIIPDAYGVTEMNNFNWEKAEARMKAQAVNGQHDDWILAAAFGYSVLQQVRTRYARRPPPGMGDEELVVDRHGIVVGRGNQSSLSAVGPRKPWLR